MGEVYFETAGKSVTLWDMNRFYSDENKREQFAWPKANLGVVEKAQFLPKRVNKVRDLKDGTRFKIGAFLYGANYNGLTYWVYEVSTLVDKNANTWDYGFIFTIFESKKQYRDIKDIKEGRSFNFSIFSGEDGSDRAVLKKICKPASGFDSKKLYDNIEEHIDELSDSLVSVLRQMIDKFKISEIYVNSMIRNDSKSHKAKKAIDIGKIILPGGIIDFGTVGYNILKTERDKIANWLQARSEIELVWDPYQLISSGVPDSNKWYTHKEKYGKELLDHDGSQDAVKKYLLEWAKTKDEANKVELTAENSETMKVNKLNIKQLYNGITHRHHLHISTYS